MNDKLASLFDSLSKSELALAERFANLIKGNEVDLEMFDRLFRNVEDANALAVLKNQLAEIATSTLQAGLTVTEKSRRNYPEKRKSTKKPTTLDGTLKHPGITTKVKESDKQIKQNVQDLGKPEIQQEPDFDL